MGRTPNESDDLSKIARWVRRQETDDPIHSKSKARVAMQLARQLKHVRPLPRGACGACSTQSERLAPVKMMLCPACARRFSKHGGLVLPAQFLQRFYCDNCLGKSFSASTVSFLICQKCASRIGKVHKSGLHDMKKQQVKDRAKLQMMINERSSFQPRHVA